MGSIWYHFGIDLGSLLGHFDSFSSFWDHFGIILGSLWDHFGIKLGTLREHFGQKMNSVVPTTNGEEPFVALLETSTFGSPGGGKESVYWLYLVTTV